MRGESQDNKNVRKCVSSTSAGHEGAEAKLTGVRRRHPLSWVARDHEAAKFNGSVGHEHALTQHRANQAYAEELLPAILGGEWLLGQQTNSGACTNGTCVFAITLTPSADAGHADCWRELCGPGAAMVQT
jgi:hypothetical protein